ncbi:MAG: DUF748 domain-containing protein [Candidatus Binataceae bacterium]
MTKSSSPTSGTRATRWIVAVAAVLAVIYAASYLIDPFIRVRIENGANSRLREYHTTLAHAHLQLLDGALTLSNMIVRQNAHPHPAIANLSTLYVHLEWSELLSGHVVADVTITQPHVHINLPQLQEQASSKVPLSKVGWQDALQAIYPFKINRMSVVNGDLSYVDTDPRYPLRVTEVNLTGDNIRNVHSASNLYPSPIHATMVAFGTGTIRLNGHANFLEEPFAGVKAAYSMRKVPLAEFEPEIKRANMSISGGNLASDGEFEYSPKAKRAHVKYAFLDGVDIDYTHSPQTAAAEHRRLATVKRGAKEVAKSQTLRLEVDEFDIGNSSIDYIDLATSPNYKLSVTNLNAKATSISNRAASPQPSHFDVTGKFMGRAATTISGDFRSVKSGPDFDLGVRAKDVDLVALNPMLRAYEHIDVASGNFSLYTQMGVREGEIHGYVKPLFTNLDIYSWEKDHRKPLTRQAYELLLGAAAHVFKNPSTGVVATEVQLSGKVDQPNISTWQAIVALVRNAFVQAIAPGFDREMQSSGRVPKQ